jgi:hypothetical protein
VADASGPDWTPPDSPKPPDVGPPEEPKLPEFPPEKQLYSLCGKSCSFQYPQTIQVGTPTTKGYWSTYHLASNLDGSRVGVCGHVMNSTFFCTVVESDGPGGYKAITPKLSIQWSSRVYVFPGPGNVVFAVVLVNMGELVVKLYRYGATGPYFQRTLPNSMNPSRQTVQIMASFSHDLKVLLIGEKGRSKFWQLTEQSNQLLTKINVSGGKGVIKEINVQGRSAPHELVLMDTHISTVTSQGSTLAYISKDSTGGYSVLVHSGLDTGVTPTLMCSPSSVVSDIPSAIAIHPKRDEVVVGFTNGKLLAIRNASGACKRLSILPLARPPVDMKAIEIDQSGENMLTIEDANTIRTAKLWSITSNASDFETYLNLGKVVTPRGTIKGQVTPALFGAPCETLLFGTSSQQFAFKSIACK